MSGAPTFLRTTETYRPGSLTLPARYYLSEEVYRRELERIFLREWLCVGREERLEGPGAYFLAGIGSESLIVLRDRDGELRAFHNVCRHRGTRLCEEPEGRLAATIQCPYHAWTYALDGRLVGAPHMDGVEGFSRDAYPLHPAPLARWEGFLFVSCAPRPRSFADAFAPVLERFARFGLPELRALRRIEYDVRANWKLVFQNYSECLHCPVIHPGLAKLSPYTSGENDLAEGPFLGGFMTLRPEVGSMTMSGRSCGVPIGGLHGEDLHRVYYYTLFPNLLLSLHPDYAMAHRLEPLGPGRTRIVCEWLFHPDSQRRAGFDPDDAVAFWDMTNRQDWHVCELGQMGIASSAYAPGPYSPRESLLAAWDREYLRRLGEGPLSG